MRSQNSERENKKNIIVTTQDFFYHMQKHEI